MKTNKLLKLVVLASLISSGAITACGNDPIPAESVDSPAGMACTMTDATTSIATNHPHGPHAVTVSKVDVMAGADKTYDLMGQASHTHEITITAAQFMTLVSGGSVMETSTDGASPAHSHVVTVSCN